MCSRAQEACTTNTRKYLIIFWQFKMEQCKITKYGLINGTTSSHSKLLDSSPLHRSMNNSEIPIAFPGELNHSILERVEIYMVSVLHFVSEIPKTIDCTGCVKEVYSLVKSLPTHLETTVGQMMSSL